MTKKIKRDEDKLEQLERENRELKSINRSLLKRLKKVDRGGSKLDKRERDEQLYIESNDDNDEKTFNCPRCSRSNLIRVSVAGRLFFRCEICEYRTKAEKTP